MEKNKILTKLEKYKIAKEILEEYYDDVTTGISWFSNWLELKIIKKEIDKDKQVNNNI